MLFLKLLAKLVRLLRSGADPRQIAGGFVLGMMLGLLSFRTLISVPIVLIIIIVNVNLASAMVGFIIFRALAFFADPLLHSLGYWVLVYSDTLKEFWITLYNVRFVPYTRFNNTVIMGNLIASLVLIIPIFLGVKRLIIGYREKYEEKIQRWKIIKILRSSSLFRWFTKLKELGA